MLVRTDDIPLKANRSKSLKKILLCQHYIVTPCMTKLNDRRQTNESVINIIMFNSDDIATHNVNISSGRFCSYNVDDIQ